MIRFACPRCARPFKSSPSMVGRLTRCPACRAEFHVPHDPRQTALHAEPEEAVPVVRPVPVRKPRRNDYPLIACGVALFLLLAAVLLWGGGVLLYRMGVGAGGGVAPPAGDPLTPGERVAWRKERGDGTGGFHAIYLLRAGGWVSHPSDIKELNGAGDIGRVWDDDERFGEVGLREAIEEAGRYARLPQNRAAAVVDLFKGEDPVPVKWLWDDSTGLKAADQPPDPAWATALRAHLVAVQKSAAR